MILRGLNKPARGTDRVTTEDLAALAPFRHQPPSLLANMAASSERLHVTPGPWAPSDIVEWVYFLQEGRLSIEDRQQVRHRLQANAAAAAFPLPVSGRWRIHAERATVIVRVPAHVLALQQTLKPRETTAPKHQDKVYLAFWQSLKSGHFQLPSLPDLAIRIGKAIDDPNTENADVARLIQFDPSLSTRVMSVVNSAAYRTVEPARTLQQAVTRLGRQQVRNLVFSCIIKGLFRSDSPLLNQRMQSLWLHSSRVAAISFVLARLTPGLDPDRALLAGVVHDIGAIPILQAARDVPQIANNPQRLDRLVSDLKGEVGSMTLSEWHFDEELIDVAGQADQWHHFGTAIPDYLDVVLLAQLHAFIGQGVRRDLPPIDQIPAFSKLALGKLTPQHSIGVLEHAADDVREIETLLRGG